jgi:hypothetical protein
VILPFDWRVVL